MLRATGNSMIGTAHIRHNAVIGTCQHLLITRITSYGIFASFDSSFLLVFNIHLCRTPQSRCVSRRTSKHGPNERVADLSWTYRKHGFRQIHDQSATWHGLTDRHVSFMRHFFWKICGPYNHEICSKNMRKWATIAYSHKSDMVRYVFSGSLQLQVPLLP